MQRVILFASASLMALTVTANAADLPRRAQLPPAPELAPATAYSWNGCYVGAQAGFAVARDMFRVADPTTGATLSRGAIQLAGATGGGYSGCNQQTDSGFVFGLEGDLDATSLGGKNAVAANTGGQYQAREQINWQGSLRLRGGYAVGNALIYATGGWAFANATSRYFGAATGNPLAMTRVASPHSGWTLGAGVEYAITDNWVARAEYRYSDFGSINDQPGAAAPFFWTSTNVGHAITEHVVRLGVAYKFGEASAPVVASF